MVKTFEQQEAENRHKSKQAFNEKADIDQDKHIQKAAEQAEREQAKREYQQRIAAEKVKIHEELTKPELTLDPPVKTGQDMNAGYINQLASHRVNEQLADERTRENQPQLQSEGNGNHNNNDQPPISPDGMPEEERKHFKSGIHQIVDDTQNRRREASRTFMQNREGLIEEAQKQGSPDPHRDISTAQREVHKAIDRDEHKRLHELFQSHGWDYEKQGVEFTKQAEQSYEERRQSGQLNQKSQGPKQSPSQEQEQ